MVGDYYREYVTPEVLPPSPLELPTVCERVFMEPTVQLHCRVEQPIFIPEYDANHEMRMLENLERQLLDSVKQYITITRESPSVHNPYRPALRASIGVVKLPSMS